MKDSLATLTLMLPLPLGCVACGRESLGWRFRGESTRRWERDAGAPADTHARRATRTEPAHVASPVARLRAPCGRPDAHASHMAERWIAAAGRGCWLAAGVYFSNRGDLRRRGEKERGVARAGKCKANRSAVTRFTLRHLLLGRVDAHAVGRRRPAEGSAPVIRDPADFYHYIPTHDSTLAAASVCSRASVCVVASWL
jgi:hypothetical protein